MNPEKTSWDDMPIPKPEDKIKDKEEIKKDLVKDEAKTSKSSLNKKKLIIVSSVLLLLFALSFFAYSYKNSLTAYFVKEQPIDSVQPRCEDECNFEGEQCEDAKIYKCTAGSDGCKKKIIIKECGKNALCSTKNKDKCYTPQLCDGEFHICISDVIYRMCKDGKTVEDSENKKCPNGMICNRNPKNFGICVAKY